MSINLKSLPHILGQGSKVMKERDFTRLLLGFKARQDRHRVQAHLERFSLVLENDDLRKSEKVNHTPRRFWVRSRNAELIEQPHVSALKESLQSELEWIGPVYRVVGREGRRGLVCPLPNVLIIKPRVGINQADLDELLRQLQEVPEKSRYGRGYRYYVLKDPQQHTVFPIQKNLAAKRELIERSGYEEMWFLSPAALVPHEPDYAATGQYPGQWNMKQIQLEAGYDISKGWSITVLVCVLDSGCGLYHPDLAHAFQTTKGINIGDPSFDGSADSSDAHGTACTGIIAAKYDNGIGIAGLADQCQIMPLKFEGASQDQLFRAINYAADNGARMISLSSSDDNWSLPAVDDNGQTIYWETLIDNAISEACTSTASRPGLVVCVSTNNKDQRHIPYPATHPMVMACGASNQFDMRKASNAPPDGECWGSNFGDEMSVVAPGVLIPTTDNTVNGYNNNGGGAIRDWSCKDYTYSGDPKGEYFFLFNGTSAATPHVAGLAALLISTYPSLTNVQVRDIIEP